MLRVTNIIRKDTDGDIASEICMILANAAAKESVIVTMHVIGILTRINQDQLMDDDDDQGNAGKSAYFPRKDQSRSN